MPAHRPNSVAFATASASGVSLAFLADGEEHVVEVDHVIADASHFLQEDAGEGLGAIIAAFVRET